MAYIIDSYSESNADSGTGLSADVPYNQAGQSFTGDGGTLDSCKFELYTDGSPTGSVYARIYAHTGTYGTNGVPTGSILATSGALDASTLPGFAEKALFAFTFTGAEKITLTNEIKYFTTLYFNGGDSSNRCIVRMDQTSPTHGGNLARGHDSWTADADKDICFYVYGDDSTTIQGIDTIQGITSINS